MAFFNWGLSPRVRGNLRTFDTLTTSDGSIPACAGEPRPRVCACMPPRVYPRVCGGTRSFGEGLATSQGLSPRVRGNP